jgi:ASC-1-like (ASCH) protein
MMQLPRVAFFQTVLKEQGFASNITRYAKSVKESIANTHNLKFRCKEAKWGFLPLPIHYTTSKYHPLFLSRASPHHSTSPA